MPCQRESWKLNVFYPEVFLRFIDRSNTSIGRCVCVPEQETMGFFHLQKISDNFYWKFPFGKSAFHLSEVPFEGGLAV